MLDNTNKSLTFIVVLITLIGLGSYLFREHKSTHFEPQNTPAVGCEFANLICEINQGDKTIVLTLESTLAVEEMIRFTLDTPSNVDNAWIEGVNMYMGKLPVVFDEQIDGRYHGWFMLGSCSQNPMIWQLHIKLVDGTDATTTFFTRY